MRLNLWHRLYAFLFLSGLGVGARHLWENRDAASVQKSFFAYIHDCHDGDTCRARGPRNINLTLRLIGIDAPELESRKGAYPAQAFATEARDYLRSRSVGRRLRVDIFGSDRYGRYLTEIFDGEKSINRELVEQGYAFAYRYRNQVLNWAAEAERSAKERGLGLWALRIRPEEPKIHRQKSRFSRSNRAQQLRHEP